MTINFLGTNGWYTDHKGNTLCTHFALPDADIILDAGNGIYKADKLLRGDKPCYLFLSHFHLDHIHGLHYLIKLRPQKLVVCCYKGFRPIFDQFVGKPYTIPYESFPYPVEFIELEDGYNKMPWGHVQALPLVHEITCYGYRIEAEDKDSDDCTDTSTCDHIVQLGKDADLLITECSLPPGREDGGWGHMNPTDAASMAKAANCKTLALTHFAAHDYPELIDREKALTEAKKTFEHTVVASEKEPLVLS